MATLFPGSLNGAALAEGNGGGPQVQLIEVGNTGSEQQTYDMAGKQVQGTSFVLAVPEGQPASAGSILQQIALSASGQQGLDVSQLASMQHNVPRMFEEELTQLKTQSKKRSRKQHLPKPQSKLSDSLPPILYDQPKRSGGRSRKQNFTILKPVVAVQVEEPVPQNPQKTQGSRRKRKSPVRSTMADIVGFGEPEFVETFYLEESDNEDDTYSNNVLHLMKERQRRREMTSQFDGLAQMVGGKGDETNSRNKVLQMGRKEVLTTTKQAASLRQKKNELRQKNLILRNRLAELLGYRTDITYESEEEDVEKVGGYSGYKSSSSDPDNDDDDIDIVDWGDSVEDSDGGGEVDFKDESESETEDNVKVELPQNDNDLYDGDGEEEHAESVGSNHGLRVKDEPASDNEEEQDEDAPDFQIRIKLDPTAPEPESAPSPKSSLMNQRTEEDLELYDRYDRVKIEPRSPVRRALFSESGSQDGGVDDRTVDEDVLASVSLDQPDQFSCDLDKLSPVNNDEDEEDFAESLLGSDLTDGIRINIDPGLIVKQEDDDSNSNW